MLATEALCVVRNTNFRVCDACGQVHTYLTAARIYPGGRFGQCRTALVTRAWLWRFKLQCWGRIEPATPEFEGMLVGLGRYQWTPERSVMKAN